MALDKSGLKKAFLQPTQVSKSVSVLLFEFTDLFGYGENEENNVPHYKSFLSTLTPWQHNNRYKHYAFQQHIFYIYFAV